MIDDKKSDERDHIDRNKEETLNTDIKLLKPSKIEFAEKYTQS